MPTSQFLSANFSPSRASGRTNGQRDSLAESRTESSAMGLLTILKKVKQKEREVRILMLGLDNAGKTTVVKKFNGEDIDLISPTLGFNIKTLEYRGFKLNIWDVGGQTSLRSYWRNYFEQTDGLIWVVDSADRARLQDCKAELQVLLQQERLAGASLLVFANKQDIAGALTAEEIREELGLDAIGQGKRHWRIEACSAFTGAGLANGVDWLVSDISSRTPRRLRPLASAPSPTPTQTMQGNAPMPVPATAPKLLAKLTATSALVCGLPTNVAAAGAPSSPSFDVPLCRSLALICS